MNILNKGILEKLLEQSSELSKSTNSSYIADEVAELGKKFNNSMISYQGKPFHIDNFFLNTTEGGSKDIKNIIIYGNLYDPNLCEWLKKKILITSEDLDFTFYPTRFINTPKGVFEVRRKTKKQWKWGLTENNTAVYPLFVKESDSDNFLTSKHILTYLFNPVYPSIKNILTQPKKFNLASGVALSEDVAVRTQTYPKKGLYLYYKRNTLPVGRIMRKSGRFVFLEKKYIFLKEKLAELGINNVTHP